MGNSTYWTLHSEGKFLEIKLFLTFFCLKLEQVFNTWYFTITRKKNYDFILKSCQKYFCFKLCYGQYKTRVSRQWWLDQWHQINEDLDFPKHHLLALSTYVQKCRLTRFNALYELASQLTSNLTDLCMFW